jgi:hypothetical protein
MGQVDPLHGAKRLSSRLVALPIIDTSGAPAGAPPAAQRHDPMQLTAIRLATLATVLAGFASAAGLLIPGLYVDSPNWIQQAQGTDLATLFLAVPVLIVGFWSIRRGSSAGQLAVVAALLYLVYNYAIFSFAVAMNALTMVHIAILGLALWSLLLRAGASVEANAKVTDRLNRRASGSLLIVVGVMFGLLWLGQIAGTATTGALPRDLIKAGISSNPVYALDLSFFLPLCALAGVGLLRRTRAGAYAFPMLVWTALMGAGVVGGFLVVAGAGDVVPLSVVVVISGLSVLSAGLAATAVLRMRAVSMRGGALRRSPQAAR